MPDSPPLLRTSERKDFWKCWWLWWEHWENGVSPLRAPTWSVFGTAWHSAMEYVYQPGQPRRRQDYLDAIDVFNEGIDDAARKVGVDDWDGMEEEESEGKKAKLIPVKELGPAMLMGYWDFYGKESEWEVIHTEQPFQINVPHPSAPRSHTLVVYAGTWDALMYHKPTRRYWLWDHKTAKAIPTSPDYLELDDQAGSYLWVAKKVLVHKGILKRSDKISGIVFNIAKKALPDERPRNAAGEALNKDGSVSKRPISPRFMRYENVRTPYMQVEQAKRVQKTAMIMQMIRNGDLPVVKNPTKDCPRCILFDLCTADEGGEDVDFIRETMYTTRDMYADHRDDMLRGGIEL